MYNILHEPNVHVTCTQTLRHDKHTQTTSKAPSSSKTNQDPKLQPLEQSKQKIQQQLMTQFTYHSNFTSLCFHLTIYVLRGNNRLCLCTYQAIRLSWSRTEHEGPKSQQLRLSRLVCEVCVHDYPMLYSWGAPILTQALWLYTLMIRMIRKNQQP